MWRPYVIYYFYFCENSHFYTPLINPTFELLWNKLTAFTQGVKKTSKLAHFYHNWAFKMAFSWPKSKYMEKMGKLLDQKHLKQMQF